jgi:ABC-type multidrug transport system ATPase subunit
VPAPLTFDDVSFRYSRRSRWVLDGFSQTFEPGATVLLGRNGAGKSTLLGLAASLLLPSSGHVRAGDLSTDRSLAAYRRAVGWMPQQVRAVPGLTVRENVAYAGWLRGMSRSQAWDVAKGAVARVDLTAEADQTGTKLSGGQLRRMGIAQALVHDARLVLLDEPAAGLDPLQRRELRGVLASLAERVDLVVSTHQTDDISSSYDRVVVLDAGRVVWSGPTTAFTAQVPGHVPESERAEHAFAELVRGR